MSQPGAKPRETEWDCYLFSVSFDRWIMLKRPGSRGLVSGCGFFLKLPAETKKYFFQCSLLKGILEENSDGFQKPFPCHLGSFCIGGQIECGRTGNEVAMVLDNIDADFNGHFFTVLLYAICACRHVSLLIHIVTGLEAKGECPQISQGSSKYGMAYRIQVLVRSRKSNSPSSIFPYI